MRIAVLTSAIIANVVVVNHLSGASICAGLFVSFVLGGEFGIALSRPRGEL